MFYRPTCISTDQFAVELEFFGLAGHYSTYVDTVEREIAGKKNKVYDIPVGFKQRLWNFFKEPKSSFAAKIWAIVDVVAISLAVLLFIIETMPVVQKELRNPYKKTKLIFFIAETACVIFFTVELVGRFFCCPDKKIFIKTLMNWIDFITILPYFVQLATESSDKGTGEKTHNSNTEALVILRVLRVVRVLKLARHSKGIIIVTKTLTSSINELALLLFFWFIGVIIFGSIMYYIEFSNDHETPFSSILESSWWAVVTMSTVGYGDMVPASPIGK